MKQLFGNSHGAHVPTDLLSAYLDGQVTAAEQDRVDAHVRQCPSCQGELESLRRTTMLLQALPRVPVPRAFTLSEAQVGIRRPNAQPAWLSGLVRGLGAVTAVALVALLAAVLLRQQPGWAPSAQVARVAPAAPLPATEPATAVMEAPAEEAPPVIAMAPSVAPTEALPEQPAPSEQPEAAPATEAVAPAVEAPTEAAVSPTPQEALQAKATAPEVAMEAADAAPAPSVVKIAPTLAAQGVRETPAGARGLGGAPGADGAAAAMAAGQPAAPRAAVSAPPMAFPGDLLPEQAGFAFADGNSLSAFDGDSGMRTIITAAGVQMPVISDSRSRIAYRVQGEGGQEIWVTSWGGTDQAMLLSEGELATESSSETAAEQRIQTVEWIPAQERLAVVTAVYTGADETISRRELWDVDAVSAKRRLVLDLGQTGRAFYAPGGDRLAVVEYGTPEDPQGSLTLYESGGGAGRVALTFPAPSGASAYASQVQWLSDGNALLFAAPGQGNGANSDVSLYRASANGDAGLLGSVQALSTSWSTDGSRLAILRTVEGAPNARQLLLAGSDGSNPKPYAQLHSGEFLGWSPYDQTFLYSSDDQLYYGAQDREPKLLGSTQSIHDPHWIAPGQLLSLLDQGAGWMLVWRNIDSGEAASLAPLPKDISYDFVSPPSQ